MFRLARVRGWKERLEKDARRARLAAEARAAELAREVERLRAERRAFPDDAGADVGDLAGWARRGELLARQERSTRARLDAMAEELRATREAHRTLRREVESLDRLEQRWEQRRRKRRERKSQELLDDAAARRFLPGAGRMFPVATSRREPGLDADGDGGPSGTGNSPSAR